MRILPRFTGALAAVMLVFGLSAAAHAAQSTWRITKTEWTEADEKGFGDFVQAIGESGCSTTAECMKSPANPYRASDPPGLVFKMDCAKWVYTLRAYYAWKNGLPFGYVNQIAGPGGDIRFSNQGNRLLSRRDLIDRGNGIAVAPAFAQLHDEVWSATYRSDAAATGGVMSDFYSPRIAPGAIRPGTAIYDIKGHVTVVYKIEPDGRILYMGADPDTTVMHSVYGPQFGQEKAALGGGFKNFRPLKLVGATRRPDGSYVGGHIVLAANDEIPDFSLEQYRGNVADAHGDGPDAMFQYKTETVGLFDYVRGSLSGGTFSFDPVYELKLGLNQLCNDMQERTRAVDAAIAAGIDRKAHPAALPGNIYASDDQEWEAYATPSRDASLKAKFSRLNTDLLRFILRGQARKPDYRAMWDLKNRLEAAYREKAEACRITYTNSDGKPVTFGFDDGVRRLFTMSFDPYQCAERRWGATSETELASCKDDVVKTRWYMAEQNLRNQADRSYVPRAQFTLADLEQGVPGSGVKKPPECDVAAMIARMGREPLMAAMEPVGY
jgi:hypothetical protein